MDSVSRSTRSWIMSKVKSKGNKSTELKLIELFRKANITGWRRSYRLVGKPDFVFPCHKLAVFVDGCFWHGHPTKCRIPNTNKDYWIKKIDRNIKRDKLITRELRLKGWKVIRIWEDSITKDTTIKRLRKALR